MTVYPIDTSSDCTHQSKSKDSVKIMEREEASRRFINWEDEDLEKRKDSNIANFARKMSSIVLGDSVNSLRHRRRSRRSLNTRRGTVASGGKQRKSLSPLQPGHKLHLNMTKGGIVFVKREKTFLETLFFTGLRSIKQWIGLPTSDADVGNLDEDDEPGGNPMKQLQELVAPHRHRPISLDNLANETSFNKGELRHLYRGFKAECPSGVLTEECFHYVYTSFFPGRDEAYNDNICSFTHYIYSLLDRNCVGYITFEDFVKNLEVLIHGSDDQKYNWIFDLYDLNGDGYITKEEMEDVVYSIFQLVDPYSRKEATNFCVSHRVSQIFLEIDPENVGLISKEKWINFCHGSSKMIRTVQNNQLVFA